MKNFFKMVGTAGSQKRARLLRRAAAGSSPKALLAAAVAVAATKRKVAGIIQEGFVK